MPRELSSSHLNPWLHRFAVLTAAATFALLGAGGLVTSHGVGMAVPDWPNTYGYNMFFFPVSRWVGGIFYEHSHRLLASGVGLMTVLLALWLYGKTCRPLLRWAGLSALAAALATWLVAARHWRDGVVLAVVGVVAFGGSWFWPRCESSPRWLRRLGLIALLAVVLQGVLGGLRVVLFKDQLGIFHATLAQVFFALTCSLALFTSRWWQQGTNPKSEIRNPKPSRAGETIEPADAAAAQPVPESPAEAGWRVSNLSFRGLSLPVIAATCVILGQLVLGAAMRHQHAGLAIPDFPTAYGKVWPAMDAASVASYNQHRVEVLDANPITAFQIGLQMVHRLAALLILGLVGYCAWTARWRLGPRAISTRLAAGWLGVILLQATLGAATIWTNKAADVATAHVLTGALALAAGTLLGLLAWREERLQTVSGSRVLAPGLQSFGDRQPGRAPSWQPTGTPQPVSATRRD